MTQTSLPSGSMSATFDEDGKALTASGSVSHVNLISGRAFSHLGGTGHGAKGGEGAAVLVAKREVSRDRLGEFQGSVTHTISPVVNTNSTTGETALAFNEPPPVITGTKYGYQNEMDKRSVYQIFHGTVTADNNSFLVTDSGDVPQGESSSTNMLLPETDFGVDSSYGNPITGLTPWGGFDAPFTTNGGWPDVPNDTGEPPPGTSPLTLGTGNNLDLGMFSSAYGYKGETVGASFAWQLTNTGTPPSDANSPNGDAVFNSGNFQSPQEPGGSSTQQDGAITLVVPPNRIRNVAKLLDKGMPALQSFIETNPEVFEAFMANYGQEGLEKLTTVLSWGYWVEFKNFSSVWSWDVLTPNSQSILTIDSNFYWGWGPNSANGNAYLLNNALTEAMNSKKVVPSKDGGYVGILSVGDMIRWNGLSAHEALRNSKHKVIWFARDVSENVAKETAINAASLGVGKLVAGTGVFGIIVRDDGPVRKLWTLTAGGASKIMKHGKFGTFYKSKSDGLWWAVDNAGHGGSAFKVFKETGKGLEWIADADRFGDFIVGKHKGPIGLFIPWHHLRGL
ncbi:MAG: hypothetical protein ABL888_01610 [Pirellulaceae bacterium]